VVEAAARWARDTEADAGRCNEYNNPELLYLTRVVLEHRSFTERPKGSNSIGQVLSMMNCRMDIRFLIIISGATNTKIKGTG
jgi:hypothetical protein